MTTWKQLSTAMAKTDKKETMTTWKQLSAESTIRLIHSSKAIDAMFSMVQHFGALDEIAQTNRADNAIAQWAATTTEAGK